MKKRFSKDFFASLFGLAQTRIYQKSSVIAVALSPQGTESLLRFSFSTHFEKYGAQDKSFETKTVLHQILLKEYYSFIETVHKMLQIGETAFFFLKIRTGLMGENLDKSEKSAFCKRLYDKTVRFFEYHLMKNNFVSKLFASTSYFSKFVEKLNSWRMFSPLGRKCRRYGGGLFICPN